MRLTGEQIERFEREGFLVLPGVFSSEEVAVLRQAMDEVFAQDTPANIREKDSAEVRTAMGLHLRSEIFARLVCHPRLLHPAMQLAGDRLYVQQVKVNVKAAFEGEPWQWHYDFATHHSEDGVPRPLALNLHVFLDDVSEFNGPLYFIPGSHRHGPQPATLDSVSTSYPLWVVDRERVRALVGEGGLHAATGPAGTMLIFGDCLVHASPANISPWDRRIFSLIVNPVDNALTNHQRPDYKHHRDLAPVVPLADDCLAEFAAAGA
jgi:ectoine hydroxylase